ncbi:MAG: S41 family peptidase [Thiolinea sp.]
MVIAQTPEVETLEAACGYVKNHFYRQDMNGLDWEGLCETAKEKVAKLPDSLKPELKQLLARLKTSHTGYFTPDDPNFAILLDVYRGNPDLSEIIKKHYSDRPYLEGVGLFTKRIEGESYIDQLLAGGAAAQAGLKTGDQLISVDGRPFHPVRSFRGKAGTAVEMTYRRTKEGDVQTVRLLVDKGAPHELFAKASEHSMRVENIDGKRIGYIRFWSLAGEEPTALFRQAFDRYEDGMFADVDAVIADIRVQVGGGFLPLDVIAPLGLPSRYISRQGEGRIPAPGLKGRFVLMVDHHTRSAAEMFAHLVKTKKVGTLVGETTAGAVTGGRLFPLPNGAVVYVSVSGVEYGGVELEGVGVSPDISVDYQLPYSEGRDPILDKALEVARELAGD